MESRGRMLAKLALQQINRKRLKSNNMKMDACSSRNLNIIEQMDDDKVNSNNMEMDACSSRNLNIIDQMDDDIYADFSSDDSVIDINYNPENYTNDESDCCTNVEKKKSRWYKAKPENWKYNKKKARRDMGLSFTTKKGKQPNFPKPVNCDKCYFKFTKNFSEVERSSLCKSYWGFKEYKKKNFILKFTESADVARHRSRKDRDNKLKSQSTKCYFLKDGKNIRICSKFFLGTLAVSNGPFKTTLKSRCEISGNFQGEDLRGKHPHAIQLSEDTENEVRSHIDSFPLTESHYCRKSSTRKYLDCKLSIGKMYELYLKQQTEKNLKSVNLGSYKKIFATEYNYSFFRPKKDQCLLCTRYNSASNDEKRELELQYTEHKHREKDSFKSKSQDKEKATDDPAFVTGTLDLQSVLQIPSSDVSQMYYSRKLCCYNLTVYEGAPPNSAYCYAWTEINGKRGSSEIGSCIYKYLTSLPKHVKEVSFFSDTYSGQNRTRNVAAILLYFINHESNNNIEKFDDLIRLCTSGVIPQEFHSWYKSLPTSKQKTIDQNPEPAYNSDSDDSEF